MITKQFINSFLFFLNRYFFSLKSQLPQFINIHIKLVKRLVGFFVNILKNHNCQLVWKPENLDEYQENKKWFIGKTQRLSNVLNK